MTINSVAITRQANYNSGDGTIRVPSTLLSGSVSLTIPPSPIDYETRVVGNGVFLPKGGVSSTAELKLKNENGTELDAQFDVLSYWQGGSIKSVKVIAGVNADTVSEKIYTLDWGAGVSQGAYTSNLGYTQDASAITVSTGNARFVISKTTGMITEMYADTAGDQSYSTQVIDGCELFQQDGQDGAQYSSDNETTATVTVTRSGVMEIEVYAVGRTKDLASNDYTQYRIWYVFNKDSDYVDIQYTMIDDSPQEDTVNYLGTNPPQDLAFECRNLGMNFSHTLTSNQQYIFGGESSNVTGNVTGEVYLLQSGSRWFNQNTVWNADPNGTSDDATGQQFAYSGVQSGEKAKGFATIHNGTVGVSMIMADFWKEWPHEISMDTTNIIAHFFPEKYHGGTLVRKHSNDVNGFLVEPNTLYHQYTGIAKTYRLRVLLHRSAPVASRIEDRLNDFDSVHFNLEQSAQNMCETDVIYNLIAGDAVSSVYDATLLNEYLIYSQTTRPHRVLPYGWRFHGNKYWTSVATTFPFTFSGLMGGSHFQATQHFTQYCRTLEDGFLEEATRQARNFMDICVAHCPSGASASIFSAVEPLPAGWVRNFNHKDVDMSVSFPADTHAHCGGLYEYYMLSGDPRAKQVLTQMADLLEHTLPLDFPIPRPALNPGQTGRNRTLGNRAQAAAERQFGWVTHIMNQYVKMNNDADYHQNVVSQVMNFFIDWWQEGGPHYIRDVQVSTCDYTQGTGTWLLDQSDNTETGLKTNGNAPFMLASMLMACIHWYDNELEYLSSGINLQEFREMLYQVIQHVNVWGFNASANEFKYTMDPARDIPNGDPNGGRNMMSPMARIYVMCKADVDASQLSNPEWYDLTTWKTRILDYGNRWETTPIGTLQGPGFYGYEHAFDQSFWKYLAIIRAE